MNQDYELLVTVAIGFGILFAFLFVAVLCN